ncbi:MAG: YdeI/OmpD-associated family protein [Bacteroidetes bacterium]|jgi:uncharacterized protein YdeI (YjbR/CyaY-like superfamily)|nr:YdeI/OmpD-associated family protein [Bacteroidota bacterium]MDF1864146.1 YdeI/OmpD-associated family protein [Saprospiraceae bacterium]
MNLVEFFATPTDFKKWLHENHNKASELWVGYYKKATKIPSMTWSESVDQALCYGWIDGIRKSVDEKSYKIRFTPRRPTSTWSAVNIQKIKELTEKGLMQPTGILAWEKRKERKSEIYAYEQKKLKLDEKYEAIIRGNEKAWVYFESLSPYYKKASVWYVMSAKREETRMKRLNILIESSEQGVKLPNMRRK